MTPTERYRKIDWELEKDDEFVNDMHSTAVQAYRDRLRAHHFNMRRPNLSVMDTLLKQGLSQDLSSKYDRYKERWQQLRLFVKPTSDGKNKMATNSNTKFVGFTKYFVTKVMWMMCVRKGIGFRFVIDNWDSVSLVSFNESPAANMPWWNVDVRPSLKQARQ